MVAGTTNPKENVCNSFNCINCFNRKKPRVQLSHYVASKFANRFIYNNGS